MSFLFAEKNNESTKDLFQKRVIYRGNLYQTQDHMNLVDFNFAEKYFYGRVSRQFVPIVVNNNKKLKQFISNKDPEKPTRALDFVVDAFEQMASNFRKCAMAGLIDETDPFLSNLLVHKAYQSHSRLYREYLDMYLGRIELQFKKRNIVVRNFDEFMTHFMGMLESTVPEYPFTKTAFVRSRFCPVYINGLTIEIADADYANDEEKMNQFINSNNWDFYVNACKNYGFMVDLHRPWRLVADIAGPTMQVYSKRYSLKSTDDILNNRYTGVHIAYFDSLVRELPAMYNRIRGDMYRELVECDGRIVTKYRKSARYTPQKFAQDYPDRYLFEIYMKIRFLEEEAKLSFSDKKIVTEEAIQAFTTKGPAAALSYFERIINKTFDCQGSLTYITKDMMLDDDKHTVIEKPPPGDASHGVNIGRFGAPGHGRGIITPDEEIDLS